MALCDHLTPVNFACLFGADCGTMLIRSQKRPTDPPVRGDSRSPGSVYTLRISRIRSGAKFISETVLDAV